MKNKTIMVLLRFVLGAGILFILFITAFTLFPSSKKVTAGSCALPPSNSTSAILVDSVSLVENAHAWDGQTIMFTGEAIGECLVRRNMAWIHLNDDAYSKRSISAGALPSGFNSGHAVWVALSLTRSIRVYGDYRHRGDLVTVTGTFHKACKEHGGDMDIHADTLELQQAGRFISHPLDAGRVIWVIGLFILAGILFVWYKLMASY